MNIFESQPPREFPHILYVITDLDLGGVPLHLRRLAGAISHKGWQPSVVSLRAQGPVGDMLRRDGFTVYSCNACCAWDCRVARRLNRVIRATQPALIHSFLFHANLASKLAARMCGFPKDRLICEIQTVEVERKWHLWVDRFTHKMCRYTIGNSPSVIEHLHKKARIPHDRLRLVRGGIEPHSFSGIEPIDRATIGVPPDSRMILWVGRLDPVKGLHILLDAFAQLLYTEQQIGSAHECRAHQEAENSEPSTDPNPEHKQAGCATDKIENSDSSIVDRQSTIDNPQSAMPCLVLAGEGPLRPNLEARIAELGLKNRAILLGSRNDVPSLLKACDLFVFPSRTEGLPNALLEAMAAACPIVTTDVPGCRDLIQNELNGIKVPYGDTQALTAGMTRLLTDRDLAQKLGNAARESVSCDWSILQTWNEYARLYGEILNGASNQSAP